MTRTPIPAGQGQDQDGNPAGTMFLMPAREGTCEMCATTHEAHMPHNAQSLFYQTRFQIENGRAPTWIDAMEHCDDDMKRAWTEGLKNVGVDVEGGEINPPKKRK